MDRVIRNLESLLRILDGVYEDDASDKIAIAVRALMDCGPDNRSGISHETVEMLIAGLQLSIGQKPT